VKKDLWFLIIGLLLAVILPENALTQTSSTEDTKIKWKFGVDLGLNKSTFNVDEGCQLSDEKSGYAAGFDLMRISGKRALLIRIFQASRNAKFSYWQGDSHWGQWSDENSVISHLGSTCTILQYYPVKNTYLFPELGTGFAWALGRRPGDPEFSVPLIIGGGIYIPEEGRPLTAGVRYIVHNPKVSKHFNLTDFQIYVALFL